MHFLSEVINTVWGDHHTEAIIAAVVVAVTVGLRELFKPGS
ncbi:hypothetical protein [Streptomyces sp. MZ04]|nr:hypothetical protein [Streptomyces sp. MZ04]